jgi:hypothetical protein
LRLDERVLHYLTGIQYLDERLSGLVEPVALWADLAPAQQGLVEQLANAWSGTTNVTGLPLIQLFGNDLPGQRQIAARACAQLGLGLYVLLASVVPSEPRELEAFMRLWEREAALSMTALLLECEETVSSDPVKERAISHLVEEMVGAFIISGPVRRRAYQRPMVNFEVRRLGFAEQRAVWEHSLGTPLTTRLNGQLERLVSQFSLDTPTIQSVSRQALSWLEEGHGQAEELGQVLWQECRNQARPRLDELAQHLDSDANWHDLVLPEQPYQLLREIARHARQRAKVYESWGFARKGARGLGLSALFAGPSGTGKTLAAEVLAAELQLDLYRIDLSQVVSKYIGETEKNLRQVFDAAESGGVVLLFDEADALFGKRSEVKDSHDRYANIEISYLLQRMETYRGLAILTTNLKSALDTAFLRRIRFIVQFPFPDAGQRAEIWRRVFPAATPNEGLDVTKLARLNLAGGNIRNIALNAAFLAADTNEPVRMDHLLRAARSECAKLEKLLTDAEIGGWV